MSWKPIVVGVDASPEAAEAVTFASRMAERARTTCRLVHALRDVLASADVPENADYRRELVEQARGQLTAALGHALPAPVLQTVTVRIGTPAVALKKAATELGAELVVLGGKHHSTLGRWLGGSTSLDVARTTAVPLLVTTGHTTIRRVLVAVDLSAAAGPTLAAAERYAALFGAELRALSVLEPLPIIPEVTPPYESTEYYAMSEELLQRDVWSLIRTPEAERVVRHGTAVETILHEAEEWGAHLLVVGSHGKSWAERVLVGSVTERLLNQLPTSLLVVPPLAAAVAERAEVPAAVREQPLVAIA